MTHHYDLAVKRLQEYDCDTDSNRAAAAHAVAALSIAGLLRDEAEREATPPSAGEGDEAGLRLLRAVDRMRDGWAETEYGSDERNALWRAVHTAADAYRDARTPPPAPVQDEAASFIRCEARHPGTQGQCHLRDGHGYEHCLSGESNCTKWGHEPVQGEAAVEALARVVSEAQACGHCDGSCVSCMTEARAYLAALDRGAVPGYGPTGASDGAGEPVAWAIYDHEGNYRTVTALERRTVPDDWRVVPLVPQ